MRKLLLFICIVFGASFANGRIIENGENNPMWGVRAAWDVNLPGKVHTNIIDERMFRPGTGGAIGAVCNIFVANKFYIEPAISVFYDTYSYKGLTILGDDYQESNPSVYKIGIRIPIVVGYSISISDWFSIAPFTGPEISYAFAGNIKLHDKDRLDIDDVSLFGKVGCQRRIECGWKFGIAFSPECGVSISTPL